MSTNIQDRQRRLRECSQRGDVASAIAAYRAFGEEFNALIRRDQQVGDSLVRAILAAVYLALRHYCRPDNWPTSGGPREAIPPDLAATIADNIEIALGSKIPQILQHVALAGSPRVWPAEAKDIGIAVAYIKCCKARLIENHKYTTTVATRYGVETRTVRKWLQDFKWVVSTDFFAFARSSEERARLIAEEMPKAGRRYQRWGRSGIGRFEFPRPGKRGHPEGGTAG